jgi:hypothetical protein
LLLSHFGVTCPRATNAPPRTLSLTTPSVVRRLFLLFVEASVLHPSLLPPIGVEPLDPLLVADIAAGLALTLPADAAPGRVLATERYDAWLLDLPPGFTWPVRPDHRVGAAQVITGSLVERWARSADVVPIARPVGERDTISLGWGTREVSNEAEHASRVVYVSSPPAGRPPGLVPMPPERPLRLVS